MANRLKHYLDFFHHAHTSLFNLNDFSEHENGDDLVLEALRGHFEGSAGTDEGAKRHAILFTTNSVEAANLQWSGHSKGRRRWMHNVLQKELGAELHVVEIQVDASLESNMQHCQEYINRHELAQKFDAVSLENHVNLYKQRFVTLQEDGSEDYLHYIKVFNYNSKVVTCNMMNTFLGSRVSRFMANVHPYRHVVYLSRVGESDFHMQCRIGGDSPLAPQGEQYSLRLAEFAHFVVHKQHQDFACVSIDNPDPVALHKLLITPLMEISEGGGIFAIGDWSAFARGETVQPGMLLRRIQRGLDRDFEDVPSTAEELIKVLDEGGCGTTLTLIFTDPAADESVHLAPQAARLWTSTLTRAKQTVAKIEHPIVSREAGKVWRQLAHREYRNLNEQYAGEYEGHTLSEIAAKQPHEVTLRSLDNMGYRYPRGESLLDVIARLEDMVQHLESYREPLMIVSHGPVLRVIYSYLNGRPREEAPTADVPKHAVIRITYDGAEGVSERRFPLGP